MLLTMHQVGFFKSRSIVCRPPAESLGNANGGLSETCFRREACQRQVGPIVSMESGATDCDVDLGFWLSELRCKQMCPNPPMEYVLCLGSWVLLCFLLMFCLCVVCVVGPLA